MKGIVIRNKLVFITVSLLCIAFLFCSIYYVISCTNFGLGSNTFYYVTAFEYDGSVWYCEKYNIKAEIFHRNGVYMVLTHLDSEEQTFISALDKFTFELLDCDSIENADVAKGLELINMRFSKRWWEVYKFKVYDITIDSTEYEKLTFTRQDR
ncbi:MAG: hypothetical protein IJF74_00140 [Clostridia bacterium]|nr:hypothetical protein [Clostridia bacterium]